jgi:hypothetical protein
MIYIKFVVFFVVVHTIAYTIAGAIALAVSKDIYEEKSRHCDFLRDMSNPDESKRVSKYFLPAQMMRGFLMPIVLIPLLEGIINFSLIESFIFFAGIMFIYTHLAAASPFIDNIEGQVYFKKAYLVKKYFLKFQFEMVIYVIIFASAMTYIIRFLS